MTFKPPNFKGQAFNCPHCAAYAHMAWSMLCFHVGEWTSTEAFIAICQHCGGRSYWLGKDKVARNSDWTTTGVMIYPHGYIAPMPHLQMPVDIRKDYEEAREISSQSPRAAAALLRLCVQKLCKHLGESGSNINKDIGELVRKGLPTEVQQALDIVRVVGNNAVHPGEISSNDVEAVAASLFELVNYIVEEKIARPVKLASMFSGLPGPALDGIAKRDKSGDS